MHAAPQPFVKAGFAGEDLGQGSVYQEFHGQLPGGSRMAGQHWPERGSAEMIFHDGGQLLLPELVNRRQSLGKDLSMTAVRPEDEVIHRQGVGHPHRSGLLTYRKMGRPGMIVSHSAVFTPDLDQVQHGLKLPDDHHVTVYPQQIVIGEMIPFLFNAPGILVNRNRGELHESGFSDLRGVYEL